jgi:ribonucleoside-diphosphate reductase beta chain
MAVRTFSTTRAGGLAGDSFAMRLYHKAKRLGTWDPQAIDLAQDVRDWDRLTDPEREVLTHLTTLFVAGEESVTLDLLPLIRVIAREGRLDEEMYLTTFLFEEAKHVETFRRYLDEVVGTREELGRFFGPQYRHVFEEALPAALTRLDRDASPVAQAEASVTYNMIVEGVLAETGYRAYHAILERHDIMPGMRAAVQLVKRDESRHLAYGVHLLSRLVAAHGEPVWSAIERTMGALLPAAIGVIPEIFARYDPMPFGLRMEEFTDFAMAQFQHRFARITQARGRSLAEIAADDLPDDS